MARRTPEKQREYNARASKKPTVKAYRKQYGTQHHWRTKLAAFDRLGGCRCMLCDCEEPVFLTIDHADGNGAQHRKTAGSGVAIYRWVKKATKAELKHWNLRVLCYNCNGATRHNTDEQVRVMIEQEHTRIRR